MDDDTPKSNILNEKLPPLQSHTIKLYDDDDDYNYFNDFDDNYIRPDLQIPSPFNPDQLPDLVDYEEEQRKAKEKRKLRYKFDL